MKAWPQRLLTAGIICSIVGSVLLIVGIVLVATGVADIDYSYGYAFKFSFGYVLIYLSIFLLLDEGIAMWIVGGIFKRKYKNKNHQ
jgi:hypothetical protein